MEKIKNYIYEFFPNLYEKNLLPNILDLRSNRKGKCDSIQVLNQRIESKDKQHILIIADRPTIQTSRIGLGFAELGFFVHQLSRWPSERVDLINKKIFYYEYDNFHDLESLKIKNSQVEVFATSWIGYNFYPLLISEIIQKNVISIHNDFPDILLNLDEDCKYIGMSKEVYKKDINFFYETCEKSKLNLNTIYSPSLDCPFNKYKNKIFFPMRPMKKIRSLRMNFTNKINNSILYTGMIPLESRIDRLFKDAKLNKYLKTAPISKMRHCILASPYKFQGKLEENFPTISKLSKEYSSRFKFLSGLPFFEIPYFAGHFSWALFYMDCSLPFDISKKHYENILPTKIASYLENGLPIVFNSAYKYTYEFLKKYNLGFSFKENEIESLNHLLNKEKKNIDSYTKNIDSFIDKNNLEDKIEEQLLPYLYS